VIAVTGIVVSNLYVPFHVFVFHARSVEHIYNILSHTICHVVAQFVNIVHHPKQSLLFHLYLDVHVFASVDVNVIVTALFLHVALLLFALTVGFTVSYIIDAFTCVLRFHGVSLYLTYTVLFHCAVVHHAHAWLVILKLLLVAYVSAVLHVLLSHENCICVTPLGSLDDSTNDTVALFVYDAHVLIVIVFDVGAVVSIVNDGTVNAALVFHAVSLTVTVHELYVHAANVLYVIVLFHALADVVADVHHHPYVIVHASVDENVYVGVVLLLGVGTGINVAKVGAKVSSVSIRDIP
jgi:hypothetical protein